MHKKRRKIYFIFDYPNIASAWTTATNRKKLLYSIDWKEFKKQLRKIAEELYGLDINVYFYVFINRRPSSHIRGRINYLRRLGYKVVPKFKESEESDIDEEISALACHATFDAKASMVCLISNDFRNASSIISKISKTIFHEDTEVTDQIDILIGYIPSVLLENTHYPTGPNVWHLNIELLENVTFGKVDVSNIGAGYSALVS